MAEETPAAPATTDKPITSEKIKPGPAKAAKPQQPSIGRIVHYTTDPHGTTKAALIIDVIDDETVDLVVFNLKGAHPLEAVAFSEEPTPGSWSWPPRA